MIGSVFAALILLLGCNAIPVVDIPKNFSTEAVAYEFTAGLDSYLDGPKLAGAANESTFEWWVLSIATSS